MKCQPIRNRILAVEQAARLPDELAAHLDECAGCQKWYRKFVAVDRALQKLPVPESDGLSKIVVLEKIRATPAPVKPTVNPTRERDKTAAPVSPTRERGNTIAKKPAPPKSAPILAEAKHKPLSVAAPAIATPLNLADDLPKKKFSFGHAAAKLWPAGLVAATLLLAVVAWYSLSSKGPPPMAETPVDPLLDKLVRLNVELANSKKQMPADRVKLLAGIAKELNQEMRDIARADASGENMKALEVMYRKVVLEGMVAQAKRIDPARREEVLKEIVGDLKVSGDKAVETADQAPEHSATSLREAARVAREGNRQIRLIMEAF